MAYSLLIQHGLLRRRVEELFYCCVCIRCRSNVFTESLSSNSKEIHIQTQTDGRYLRHYATSRKVAGSSPDEVIGFFFQLT
jgi:hypothetical protein